MARSPVVEVPEGSNMRIDPPGDEGLCSTRFGTTKVSPSARCTTSRTIRATNRNVEHPGQDQEEFVGVHVAMPHVLAERVRDPDIVIVHASNDAGAAHLAEISQPSLCSCHTAPSSHVHASLPVMVLRINPEFRQRAFD